MLQRRRQGKEATWRHWAPRTGPQVSRLSTLRAMSPVAYALRAFRAADPDADAFLPESLRDWARTVE